MEEQNNVVNTSTTEKEGSKFGWGVLGFFIPLVGFILFLVWRKDKKKAAKASGIGALVGFLLGLVSTITLIALGLGTILGIGVTSDYYDNNTTPVVEEKKEDDVCIGNIEKGSNKYEYTLNLDNDYSKCEAVTYKLNSDFTVKVERKAESTHNDIYINDVKNINIIYNNNNMIKVAVVGKTLIINTMHQTTVNGGISTTLINTDGEEYNFQTNPEGRGRDINKLNTDGMLDEDFRINDFGDLVIKGTQFEDMCLFVNEKCIQDICSTSLEDLINSNNVSEDYPLNVEFSYKLDDNGLFNFDYSSKNTTKTLKEYYNETCNR